MTGPLAQQSPPNATLGVHTQVWRDTAFSPHPNLSCGRQTLTSDSQKKL